MLNRRWGHLVSTILIAAAPLGAALAETITLKASHQFPGGKGRATRAAVVETASPAALLFAHPPRWGQSGTRLGITN